MPPQPGSAVDITPPASLFRKKSKVSPVGQSREENSTANPAGI
jgi:hypothetical protein